MVGFVLASLLSRGLDSQVMFKRTYAAGEVVKYDLRFDGGGIGPHFTAVMKQSVVTAPTDTTLAKLQLEATEFKVSSGAANKPAVLKGESGGHGLIRGMAMNGNDYVVVLFSFAGF